MPAIETRRLNKVIPIPIHPFNEIKFKEYPPIAMQNHAKRMIPNPYSDFTLPAQAPIMEMTDRDEMGNSEDCNKSQFNGASMTSGNPKDKSSNIALKAAEEAKAATEAQAAAGQAASRQVKMQLAEKAMQAARAAEAALAGKQQIVEQLQQEVREAEAVVQEQSASLQNSQQNVQAAVQAAQQAQSQLKTLTQAVQMAQANVGNSEQAANGAQTDFSEKTQLLEAAKTRVEQLLRQLSNARTDFNQTKQSAYKAACAAHDAKVNAERARRQLLKRFLSPEQVQHMQELQRQRLEHRSYGL